MSTPRKSRRLSIKEESDYSENEELPSKTSTELTCVHCEREFTTKFGLDYHVDNFVCRPEQRPLDDKSAEAMQEPVAPPSPKPKQKRRKKATVFEKTCPHCDTLFTSLYGLKYHLTKFVCRPDERPEIPEHAGSSGNSGNALEDETQSLPAEVPKDSKQRAFPKKPSKESTQLSASIFPSESTEDADEAISSTSRQRKRTAAGENDNESEYSESDDLDVDDAASASKKRQKNNETFDCPHCCKVFKSIRALEYHQHNFVCRPQERPDGPVQKGRRKLDDNSEKRSKFKKFRGAEEDRTCPDCGAIFTSVHGFLYHKSKCSRDSQQFKLMACLTRRTVSCSRKTSLHNKKFH